MTLPFLESGDQPPCMEVDPDLFFEDGRAWSEGRNGPMIQYEGQSAWYAPAKKFCHGCPWQADCLDYAMNNPWLDGVWGGLSHSERQKLSPVRRKTGWVPTGERVYPMGAKSGVGDDWVVNLRKYEELHKISDGVGSHALTQGQRWELRRLEAMRANQTD